MDTEVEDRAANWLNDRATITLPNDYQVSIVWHYAAYANRETGSVETAIIDPNGQFVPWSHDDVAEELRDDVQANQTAVELAKTLAHAASL